MGRKAKVGAYGASLAVLVWASGGVAAAQDSQSLDEVVVTARRSEERLQDIPLAISVQTSEQLSEKGITNLESLARFTPSLQFKSFVTTFHGNPTIRGLSQVNTTNAVGNVGVFINGVYLQRGYMVDTSLGDFARIEVVKGPQSALYGQNTFAGAVNFVTVEPSSDYVANFSATYGSAGRQEIKLGLGGPIIPDILMGRVFLASSSYDGTWTNNTPGSQGDTEEFGGHERRAWSAALKFTPTDYLTFDLFYQKNEREEEIRPFYTLDGNFVEDRLNCGPISAATGRPSLFCGTFPVSTTGVRTGVGARPADPFSAGMPPTLSNVEIMRFGATWDVTESLSVNYIYGDAKGDALEDLSFASNTFNPTGRAIISQQHEGGELEYTSHEARVVWEPENLPVTLQLGYFTSHAQDRFIFGVRNVAPGQQLTRISENPLSIPPGFIPFNNLLQEFDIESYFGRGSFSFLDDRATVTAEARWTQTEITYNDILARTAVPSRPLLQATYENWSPRFTAEYKLTDNSLLYASAARGIKAGGFNGYVTGTTTLLASEQSFGEETNWTYEFGAKNTFLDGRLVLNANVFYVDWADKQASVQPANFVPPAIPTVGTVNPNIFATIGDAEAIGVEVEGSFTPIEPLTMTYSLAWMDPKYGKNAIAANFVGLCDDIICARNGRVEGNQIERTSKWAGSFGATYTHPLTDTWNMFVGADVTYQSKQYTDTANLGQIDAFTLVNARIGVESDRYKAWLWADNLADEEYISNVFYIQNTRQFTASYGEKRTVGVTVTANFSRSP
jgi:iron complex outermembrane recepter protein